MNRIAPSLSLSLLVALGLVVTAVVFGVRTLGSGDSPSDPADGRNATVVRVVDGDTVVVRIGGTEEAVRLIGIDTPESVARDQPLECYGPEASDRLGELLPPGTPLHLERDVEPRDRYGRLLAYVHRVEDRLFVNHDQVAEGFAVAKEYPPNTTFSADLSAAQREAQAMGAGLWSACQ